MTETFNSTRQSNIFTARRVYPLLKPYAIVTYKGKPLEIMNWPWDDESGKIMIGARTPGDPGTYDEYPACLLDTGFIDLRDLEEHAKCYNVYDNYRDPCESDPGYAEYCEQMILAENPEFNGELPPAYVLGGIGVGATSMMHTCRVLGHQQLVDRSYGGPDSGNMDHECVHCGHCFHHTLY